MYSKQASFSPSWEKFSLKECPLQIPKSVETGTETPSMSNNSTAHGAGSHGGASNRNGSIGSAIINLELLQFQLIVKQVGDLDVVSAVVVDDVAEVLALWETSKNNRR